MTPWRISNVVEFSATGSIAAPSLQAFAAKAVPSPQSMQMGPTVTGSRVWKQHLGTWFANLRCCACDQSAKYATVNRSDQVREV